MTSFTARSGRACHDNDTRAGSELARAQQACMEPSRIATPCTIAAKYILKQVSLILFLPWRLKWSHATLGSRDPNASPYGAGKVNIGQHSKQNCIFILKFAEGMRETVFVARTVGFARRASRALRAFGCNW